MSATTLPLIGGVIQSVTQLHQDFTGVSVNFSSIGSFFLAFLGAVFLFLLLYLIGYRLRNIFFKDVSKKPYAAFFAVVPGYAVFGTGIAIIGMLSLLTPLAIGVYIAVLTIAVLLPLSSSRSGLRELNELYSGINIKKFSFLDVIILLFILIAFLRLVLPESAVDAVGYHLSYPKEYLAQHSLMIQPLGVFYFAAIPQLGEMLYVVTQAFGLNYAINIIPFFFYLTIIFMFIKMLNGKGVSGRFAALMFVTAPIVIKETSIAYTDMQWIFCWVVAIWIVTSEKLTPYTVLLASLAFGATLATKPQTIYFVLVFGVYILLRTSSRSLRRKLLNGVIFLLGVCAITGIWYFRAYLLTGDPFYPAFSHSFGGLSSILPVEGSFTTALRERLKNMIALDPVATVYVLILALTVLPKAFTKIPKASLMRILQIASKQLQKITGPGLITLLLIIEFVGLPLWFAESRYLIYGYLPVLIVLAPFAKAIYESSNLTRYLTVGIVVLMLGYYLLQTILVLPYGFGWANQGHYLTRILSRDNSSYYDFDEQFSKKITSNDLVGLYGVGGIYYADFHYRDVAYILKDNDRSLLALKKAGVTKLLIKGGTIERFCKQEGLSDCGKTHASLIASYPPALQYLYSLKQ